MPATEAVKKAAKVEEEFAAATLPDRMIYEM